MPFDSGWKGKECQTFNTRTSLKKTEKQVLNRMKVLQQPKNTARILQPNIEIEGTTCTETLTFLI